MKFERLHITAFGRLAGFDLDFGDGLTVVSGPNEAGKSTIVECLLRLLFGFPEQQYNKARKRFEPWGTGIAYSASLRYRLDNGRRFEVARDFAKPDVPTETIEADTRRPVSALSGNKSASPGENSLCISLDVYRAAAVVSAGDFVDEPNGAVHALADRLAAVIGAAGDSSAAEAIERLKKAHGEIGLTGQHTPLGKASREADEAEEALRHYRDDYAGLVDNIRKDAEYTERVRDLTSRRARSAAALALVRLRSVRARITEAADAQRLVSAAAARRGAVISASPAALAHRDEIESAIEAHLLAQHSASDAAQRAAARDGERAAIQRDVDGANAALLEKRALVARLDETIAAHEVAAAGKPAISREILADLEREADEADAAESRARTLDTAAAIARQRARPTPMPAVALVVAFVIFIALWFATRQTALAVLTIVAVIGALAAAFAYGGAARRRAQSVAYAEAVAADAAEASAQANAALDARCRALGCASVTAVRAARTAQADLDRVRAERSAAGEAATLLASKRDSLARHLDDFNAIAAERTAAERHAAAWADALKALLSDVGVEEGALDDRVAAFRRLLEGGEAAAHADAAAAQAREALERVLRGATIESLEDDATRYADEASSGDPGEYADRGEADLEREVRSIDAQLRESERLLEGAKARIAEFERLHPVAEADLEERAAAALRTRDRLRAARDAAEKAWTIIEEVKDAVHRDFTPPLNDAVSKTAAAMTGGRYAQAFIDQNDFTVRVLVPETGKSLETDALSTGTIEQFQFALRAALATALGSGERVPILYDDALAHADDGRFKAALQRAAELARDGEQIVFFTQRGDVETFAAALPDVRLVRLAGPSG